MARERLYFKERMERGAPRHVKLMRFIKPEEVIRSSGHDRMITVPERSGATPFYDALARFDRTRRWHEQSDKSGQMASRGEYYAYPELSPQQLADIAKMRAWLRQYGVSPAARWNDTLVIPLEAEREDAIEWKPMTVATYGPSPIHPNQPFMIDDIMALARDAWNYNRLIKIAQVHGAAHSVAMLIRMISDRIPFEFVFHNDVPNEMPDELEYVKYIVLYELKLPLVVTHLGSTAEEYLYWKALLMSDRARWCTNEWKIKPFRTFLKKIFFPLKELPDNVKYVDIIQYLGLQAAQSKARANLNPLPSVSEMSLPKPEYWENAAEGKRIMRIFNALPVHDLNNEDNIRMIHQRGWMRNPSELEWGRHGCLLCPYASLEYYWQLQQGYPELFRICQQRVREGNRRPGTNFTFIAPKRITGKYTQPPFNMTKPIL